MSTTIAVVATIIASPANSGAVEQALRTAVPLVREESGCEQYVLHQDLAQPGRFVMIERWRDEAALTQHTQAPAFQALARALDGIAELDVVKLSPIV